MTSRFHSTQSLLHIIVLLKSRTDQEFALLQTSDRHLPALPRYADILASDARYYHRQGEQFVGHGGALHVSVQLVLHSIAVIENLVASFCS